MKIAFRVDASDIIGTGHIMRCLVLAQTLREKGADIAFVVSSHKGHMAAYVKENFGFEVILVKPDLAFKGKGYLAWLGVDQELDADRFLRIAIRKRVDMVVIDHYGINIEWEFRVRKNGLKIVVIDDLANRRHLSDLLIDQNLWPNGLSRYKELVPVECRMLLGPKYALLRSNFSNLRSSPPNKANLLITFFGGTDPTRESEKFLKAIARFSKLPFNVLTVTGCRSVEVDESITCRLPSGVRVEKFIHDFEVTLSTAKYVIGASGVSNWERFCLKIPSTIVAVAENQIELASYLDKLGAVTYLGEGSKLNPSDYEKEIERLILAWRTLDTFNFPCVDGLGASRATTEIMKI